MSHTVDGPSNLIDVAPDFPELACECADLRQLHTDDVPIDCHFPQVRRHVVGAVLLHLRPIFSRSFGVTRKRSIVSRMRFSFVDIILKFPYKI